MSGLEVPLALGSAAVLRQFLKDKFSSETKDDVSSAGDYEETRTGKWFKIQNALNRILISVENGSLTEAEMKLICTPAVVEMVTKLELRMLRRGADMKDLKNTLKSDLDLTLGLIEENLGVVLTAKKEAHEEEERRKEREEDRKHQLNIMKQQHEYSLQMEALNRRQCCVIS